MMHSITLEVGAELRARGVPFAVVYGPERMGTTVTSAPRIVIERDRKAGDGVGPARSVHTNPHMRAVRAIGCVARIFGKSNAAGAGVQDHEAIADQLVDKVLVALDKVVRSNQTLWRPVSGKFLTAEDLAARGLTTWPGVVYELQFTVDRGVFDTDFAGEAAPETSLGGVDGVTVKSKTKVTVNGIGTPETACGG